MSVRKKLPSAIRHTMDGLREAAAGNGTEWRRTPMSVMASNEPSSGASAAPDPAAQVIERTGPFSVSDTVALDRAASISAKMDATKRLAQARAIVDRHATYSAFGGIVPLPIASAAGITTIIIRMVKMLSNLYGVPFERDRARAIIVGLVGGTVPTGFAAVTTSTLFFVVPSGALMGLVVSSFTAIACTRSIGQIFIEHFESGATLHDLSIKKS